MIIDQLKNAPLYRGISKNIATALHYLQNTDLSIIKPGKYDIDDSNIYSLVQQYKTKAREKGSWEAHRRYIDIQYVVKGSEIMGFANVEHLITGEYDDVKDVLTLQGEGDFFIVRAGTFVIFGPQDAHMPSLSVTTPQSVEKIVIKVRV